MTDTTAASSPPPTPTAKAPDESAAKDSRFGPIQAIALIMGSIIGVGIFNLPTSPPGRRRPVRLRPGRLREQDRVPQRLVVLDHRLGRERRHRRGLGLVRGAV